MGMNLRNECMMRKGTALDRGAAPNVVNLKRARLHQRALAIAGLRNFAPQSAQPPFNANLEYDPEAPEQACH
jgi:hypothetical protein